MGSSCSERLGNKVENAISSTFAKLGLYVATNPRKTILFSVLLTAVCGAGFARWTTENRSDKLWVPQGTRAEAETAAYRDYFGSETRFNSVIVQAKQREEGSDGGAGNVLSRETLVDALQMHRAIVTNEATVVDDAVYAYDDLCVKGGTGECITLLNPTALLGLWDYDLGALEADQDVLSTINARFSRTDLEALLGNPQFDDTTNGIVSASAFTLLYLTASRVEEVGSEEEAGTEADPVNEAWEADVFLKVLEADSVAANYPTLEVDYLAGRSFGDEFGGAIRGDLVLVQVSYAVVFIYLGANLGKFLPGPDSRWTMALAALVLVGLSIGAGFGVSAAAGFFFGPVHSLLPFILLGIGVDDVFVIVNAFDRERRGPRSVEDDDQLAERASRAMGRAGASITVTSLTDFVAFVISVSSSLPALSSFCAYAAIAIVFLWGFASTFFASTLVLDERRQRDNRRECLCCLTRGNELEKEEDGKFEEGGVSTYFRNYHAPVILSRFGKVLVMLFFSGLLAFGVWGATNLSVEDTQRSFIPSDSYLTSYINSVDKYFPTSGIDLAIVFEGSSEIYEKRSGLVSLEARLANLSTSEPYIAEPNTDSSYSNVIKGYDTDLTSLGREWPNSEQEFVSSLSAYISGAGRQYASDVAFSADGTAVDAVRVNCAYVALTTKKRNGNIVDDAEKQVRAMDATRELVDSWNNDDDVDGLPLLPPAFAYSDKFITVEGFKIIRRELFLNVALALIAVAAIVFVTVASPVTAVLVTLNVAACIIEILGFMHAIDIAIDSVSVINIVLAVGLSIDYSAHVGHCFMLKGGTSRNRRSLEALADVGSAVLNGAASTFLAVVVLLFSSSYVFATLAKQFALTVGLGIAHGLVLLPVLLSLCGPKAFEAAEMPVGGSKVDTKVGSPRDD